MKVEIKIKVEIKNGSRNQNGNQNQNENSNTFKKNERKWLQREILHILALLKM